MFDLTFIIGAVVIAGLFVLCNFTIHKIFPFFEISVFLGSSFVISSAAIYMIANTILNGSRNSLSFTLNFFIKKILAIKSFLKKNNKVQKLGRFQEFERWKISSKEKIPKSKLNEHNKEMEILNVMKVWKTKWILMKLFEITNIFLKLILIPASITSGILLNFFILKHFGFSFSIKSVLYSFFIPSAIFGSLFFITGIFVLAMIVFTFLMIGIYSLIYFRNLNIRERRLGTMISYNDMFCI